jgi:hypothetical protein
MKSDKNKAVNPYFTLLKVLGLLFGIGLIFSILIPLLMPVYDRYQAEQRGKREAPFLSLMSQYTAPLPLAVYPNPPGYPFNQQVTTPKLQGKILVVNLVTRAVDELFHELPSDRRANVPEEVGVVVWMDCDTNTFHYTEPAVWVQEHCEVSMIDWSARLIRYQTEFAGASPPDTIPVDKRGFPDYPDQDSNVDRQRVLEWILARVE